MGFFDNIGSNIAGLFGNADPARAAQVRGGLLGAAQALMTPYSGLGGALVGAGQGAMQGKDQYIDSQYRELRTAQLQDQLKQSQAQRAALNNLFLKTQPTQAPPGMQPQTPAPAAAGGMPEPMGQTQPIQAPQPQFHLPPGFNSPEEFQQYAAAVGPEKALERLYPDQPKYTGAPRSGINPATNQLEEYVIDPANGQPKWTGIRAEPKPPTTAGGMMWDGGQNKFIPIPGYAAQQAADRAPQASHWQILEDPKNHTQYRYNPDTFQATDLYGKPYVPSGAAKLAGGNKPRTAPAMALQK